MIIVSINLTMIYSQKKNRLWNLQQFRRIKNASTQTSPAAAENSPTELDLPLQPLPLLRCAKEM